MKTENIGTYVYGNANWKDLLTEYNGNEITYDEIGNPLTYYNGTELKWTMGHRLKSAVRSDGVKIKYTYNADGLRTSKTINNVKFNYYWNENKLTGQTFGGNTMYFRYDGDTLIGFEYNNNQYYYVTDLQGDIIAILNSNGNCVAEYKYDSWGNCTVTKDKEYIASVNPLRYRGYYFDSDTGLYYLQSRYYDSNTGRFINADDFDMLQYGVGNLFAYCDNNPVNFIDHTGNYSVNNALSYAKKWWNGKNSKYRYYTFGDCANFVSQCLYAGGLHKMDGVGRKSGWHSYKKTKKVLFIKYTSWDISESWSLVKGLQTWLIHTMHYRQHLITSKSELTKIIKNGSLKPGAVVLMSTKYNGRLNHAVIVGRVTKSNAYYYAHTSNRDANSNDYGLIDYFNDAPKKKNGYIAVFYIY